LPSAAMAEEMETPGKGQIRALITFAGDPVLSVPNGPRLKAAIEKLDFHVAVDFYLNETARLANLVLPPLHAFETGNYDLLLMPFTARNFARYSAAVLPRPDGALDNFQICHELALRLMPGFLRAPLRKIGERMPDRVLNLLL